MHNSLFHSTMVLRRLWHRMFCRHGHGIHSPFAYNLVRNVINEQHKYYIYTHIAQKRKAQNCLFTQKELELIYRLTLHCKPHLIATGGAVCKLTQWVMQQGGEAHCRMVQQPEVHNGKEQADGLPLYGAHIDLLFIQIGPNVVEANRQYEALFPHLSPQCVVIVAGIRGSKKATAWWNRIRMMHGQQSFDLIDFGLIYFNATLTKGHHRVGY